MLEYPEMYTIAQQMKQSIVGKTIQNGELHKTNSNLFMSSHDAENYQLLSGGKVTEIDFFAPELYIRLDNGYGILICQCGGKILYHPDSSKIADNHSIHFTFTDGTAISYTMKLWSLGIFAVKHEDWENRKQANAEKQFQPLAESQEKFIDFVKKVSAEDPLAAKTFLAKYVAGVMSSCAGAILLKACVHPSKKITVLTEEELGRIYQSMYHLLSEACKEGGRSSESDFYGAKGGCTSVIERKDIGKPCPNCGNPLEKISVGGIMAYCPVCQKKK